MADKNKPGNGNQDDFEHDDPFAELARLIGPRDDDPPRDASYTPDTADDLTDELLREFDSLSEHAQPAEPATPPDPAPSFADEGFHFEEPQAAQARPVSIWDELPAEPVPEPAPKAEAETGTETEIAPEPRDETFVADMRDTISGYQTPQDQPRTRVAPLEPERDTASYQPEDAVLDEQELDLDLDEIALELSEIALPEERSGPLADVASDDASRDDEFDPAALISNEEPPQPVDELDLPRMGDDEVVPTRASPDPYEFDLDEELADVLASQPALVDPLQEQSLEQELQEEHAYYQPRGSEAYEQAYEQAAVSQAVYPDEQPDFEPAADDEYFDVDDGERRSGLLSPGAGGAGRIALIVGGAVVIAVLFVFAGMRYLSGDAGGDPVVITADKSSVKEAPEDPGGEVVPNQDNAVFNDVPGTLAEAPRQGSLIASDQTPTDVESVAPNPLAESASSASSSTDGGGLEPRKVRTVIVRPDGTVVEREATQPSRPSTTGIRGLETVTAMPDDSGQLVTTQSPSAESDERANETPSSAAPDAMTATETTSPAGETADGIAATDASEEPAAADAPVEDFGIANVPLPTRRPAGGPPPRVAAAQSAAATPAPSAPQTGTQRSSAYAMQIASLPSQQEAQQAYRRLAAQYPAVLGRRPVEIIPAAIAGKGTYYRVRIPAASLSEALSLCESFKAQGGSCFVPR